MEILVINASPRLNGNTIKMTKSFEDNVDKTKHNITHIDLGQMKINGCVGCEHCHKVEKGVCCQDDDMKDLLPLINSCEVLIIGSPVYYYGFTGQLQSMITRLYSINKPANLKKTALFMASGNTGVYEGMEFAYHGTFTKFFGCEDLGVFKVSYENHDLEDTLSKIAAMAKTL